MKKQFFSKFNKNFIILPIIFLIVLFIFLYKDKIIMAYDNEESDYYIEYEATVHKLYIVKNIYIYIIDTDEHVLIFDFDPQLLLLDEGEKILVYIDKYQSDNNVIYIDNYKQFGFVPKDYNY